MGDQDETIGRPGADSGTPKPVSGINAPAPDLRPDTEPQRDVEELARIRTYADDMSDEIKKKGATLSSIVGAERERSARELALDDLGPQEQKTLFGKKNLWLISGAIALVVVGVVAVGTALYFMSGAGNTTLTTPSIIFPNKVVPVDVTADRSLPDQLTIARNASTLSLGEIARYDITLEGATTTAQTLLELLGAPPALIREATSIMVGVHAFNYTQPFLIIGITQYDRAFGAMLGWEEEMGRGLGNFYRPRNGTVVPTLTFTDVVYQNIDTRQSQSAWPILYAFPRRDVLIVTTNQQTLQEILTRLNAESAAQGR